MNNFSKNILNTVQVCNFPAANARAAKPDVKMSVSY